MKRFAVLLLLGAGCALEPVLVPDATAQKLGDKVAFTETQGVRVSVNGDAWKGDPFNLPDVLTPLHVSIENGGPVPLRLAYRDFAIVGESGMRYSALSPLQIDSQLPTGSIERPDGRYTTVAYQARARVPPRFHGRRFYVAPHYGYYYPGYPLWGSPFPYSSWGMTAYSWPQTLPTEDMIAEALPEGVLEPGGHVDGFVYFQGVTRREQRVRFDFKMYDAQTGQQLGEAVVPFMVKYR